MARRPSTVSVDSSYSTATAKDALRPPPSASSASPAYNFQPSWPPRSASLTPNTKPLQKSEYDADPDEMLTRYTVAEVKHIQQRLRADAEDKQEELRLMVGERYRDLLQASTSILSIAQSSRRVSAVLEETKSAIINHEREPEPRRAQIASKDEAQLQTLQLLAAHLKLLLDAPEHLWRLIERQDYFQATWLFLLARVVHRALIRDDLEDDSWSSQGIDVPEQFPLVERQWEAVSQFRSQIIHKATFSLREYSLPYVHTCATLLSLHLLDSRPLLDTASTLLAQRARTLTGILTKSMLPSIPLKSTLAANGHPPEAPPPPKSHLRQLKSATTAALDALSHTVHVVRDVFREDPETHRSKILRVLEYMQSEAPDAASSQSALPKELLLTTQNLLASLPSSTYFLLLPPNLRTYRPYVDLSSSSTAVSQDTLAKKLDEWFRNVAHGLREAMQRWLADIASARDVWRVRRFSRKTVNASTGLEEGEKSHLLAMLDDAFSGRVVEVWKGELKEAERAFRERLFARLASLADSSTRKDSDSSLAEQRFACPPLPFASHLSTSSIPSDSSFQRYQATLRRQLAGRTASLEDVLSVLEHRAQNLQDAFSLQVIGSGDDNRTLAIKLMEVFQPDAAALCSSVADALSEAFSAVPDEHAGTMSSLMFLSAVADELLSSSPFVGQLGCGERTEREFRERMQALSQDIMDRWQRRLVANVVHEHSAVSASILHSRSSEPPASYMPSPALVRSLFSMSCALQQMVVRDRSRRELIARQTLARFVEALLSALPGPTSPALGDLLFLQNVVGLWGSDSSSSPLLADRIAGVRRQAVNGDKSPPQDGGDLGDAVREHVMRMQTLLAPLLPSPTAAPHRPEKGVKAEKFAALLPHGVPPVDQTQVQPALELAKSSMRFGLLLVGGGSTS